MELPRRMRKLPKNEGGYVIPWFVGYVDGKPDFRVIGPDKIVEATKFKLCWLCGEPMGVFKAFVIGPMCAVNLTSSEPPSHLDCGTYAAIVCPFLSNPDRPRRLNNLPEDKREPAGISLDRNPKVALVWVTTSYKLIRAEGGAGFLFRIGPPESCFWFSRGRTATREEIMDSIATGLPFLLKLATAEGPDALKFLNERVEETKKLLPA